MAVALAEEMPVNETIDLEGRLRDELGMDLAAHLRERACCPSASRGAEAEAMASVDGAGSPAAREALAAALRRTRAGEGAALAGRPAASAAPTRRSPRCRSCSSPRSGLDGPRAALARAGAQAVSIDRGS